MRCTLIERCSLENPSSLDKWVRTTSPSNKVTLRRPCAISLTISILARVVLPAPDNPVKNTVNPLFFSGGYTFFKCSATAGIVNHSGNSSPFLSISRSCVPEIETNSSPACLSLTNIYFLRDRL